jgi:putative PIN family toxin of toxin-antitoxin system
MILEKAVIDTNIFVSAFLTPNGTAAKIIDLFVDKKIKLCYDNRILSEYREVLSRPKFGFRENYIENIIDFIADNGIMIMPEPVTIDLS